jgi:hypothetical protein
MTVDPQAMMAEHLKRCHGSHTCDAAPIGHILLEFPRSPNDELQASLLPMCDEHLTQREPFYRKSSLVKVYVVRWP